MMQYLGVNPYGLMPYRCALAWKSFVRSCLEYGLAVLCLENKDLERLERTQCDGLRSVLGGYRSTSKEVLRMMAEAEPMEVRVRELQARYLVRALQAEDTALVKRVLPDVLNDSTSTIRRALKSNLLWEQIEGVELPMGPEIRGLWSPQEVAAV